MTWNPTENNVFAMIDRFIFSHIKVRHSEKANEISCQVSEKLKLESLPGLLMRTT